MLIRGSCMSILNSSTSKDFFMFSQKLHKSSKVKHRGKGITCRSSPGVIIGIRCNDERLAGLPMDGFAVGKVAIGKNILRQKVGAFHFERDEYVIPDVLPLIDTAHLLRDESGEHEARIGIIVHPAGRCHQVSKAAEGVMKKIRKAIIALELRGSSNFSIIHDP